ncbi:Membrane protein insertase YidC [Buchnera aphidicola (Periphyllus testudinaceus)]|uniref:membrane protein insertase YidC n=1 Tax=Buchnera aphidicola TaxID=9 RepID=UPI003463C0EA
MYFKRNFFIFALFLISFFLWQTWKKENFIRVNNLISKSYVSSIYPFLNKKNDQEIIIKTDVFLIVIDKYNGNIKIANLLKYKDKKNSLQNFKFLKTNSNFLYQVRNGFNKIDKNNEQILLKYQTKKNFYKLLPNHKKLIVPMICTLKNGIKYKKILIFYKGKYNIKIKNYIYNLTKKNIHLNMFGEIVQTINPVKNDIYDDLDNNSSRSYRGTAYSSDDEKFKKYDFNLISSKKNLHKTIKSGWIAMLQKYFATAWIPSKNLGPNTIYTKNIDSKIAIIGYHTSNLLIPHNSLNCIESSLWIGPEIQKEMKLIAPNLDLTVDYGFLWFLSQPLFQLLNFLYKIFGNWGFSIILITIIIRIFTYPLNKSQYISMIKLRSLQPKLNYLKNKYKNNKTKMTEKILALYKKEKISPFSGLFPVFFQMPIFLSLYYMLTNSIELRDSPFIFWIQDLSSYDPFYILPILMGITMFYIQRLSSQDIFSQNKCYKNSMDSLQEQIAFVVPMAFIIFFLWFPSGLVLYYIVNNLISIIQQKHIYNNLKKNKNFL